MYFRRQKAHLGRGRVLVGNTLNIYCIKHMHALYGAHKTKITACPDALYTYQAVPNSEPLPLLWPLPWTLFLHIPTWTLPHFIQVSPQMSPHRELFWLSYIKQHRITFNPLYPLYFSAQHKSLFNMLYIC